MSDSLEYILPASIYKTCQFAYNSLSVIQDHKSTAPRDSFTECYIVSGG